MVYENKSKRSMISRRRVRAQAQGVRTSRRGIYPLDTPLTVVHRVKLLMEAGFSQPLHKYSVNHPDNRIAIHLE